MGKKNDIVRQNHGQNTATSASQGVSDIVVLGNSGLRHVENGYVGWVLELLTSVEQQMADAGAQTKEFNQGSEDEKRKGKFSSAFVET